MLVLLANVLPHDLHVSAFDCPNVIFMAATGLQLTKIDHLIRSGPLKLERKIKEGKYRNFVQEHADMYSH